MGNDSIITGAPRWAGASPAGRSPIRGRGAGGASGSLSLSILHQQLIRTQARVIELEDEVHRIEGQLALLSVPSERRHRRRAARRILLWRIGMRLRGVRPGGAL